MKSLLCFDIRPSNRRTIIVPMAPLRELSETGEKPERTRIWRKVLAWGVPEQTLAGLVPHLPMAWMLSSARFEAIGCKLSLSGSGFGSVFGSIRFGSVRFGSVRPDLKLSETSGSCQRPEEPGRTRRMTAPSLGLRGQLGSMVGSRAILNDDSTQG